MRYLVTGGCGFIGSRLVGALLADGHEVVVMDDLSTGSADALAEEAVLIEGQVESVAADVTGAKPLDGIFHLAAVSSVELAEADPERAQRVNVEGTRAILDLAAAAAPRPLPVVLASSAAVYGQVAKLPISEDHETRPLGIYGASKLAAEGAAAAAFQNGRVPSVAVRLFNVYGPWSLPGRPPAGVIAAFCRRIAAGESISIHGDGRQQRDFLYIDDAVTLLKVAMASISTTPRQLVVNGCTGAGTSLLDLASCLSALSPRPLAWSHSPRRPSDIAFSVGNPGLAGKLLRYYPTTRLEAGLAQVMRGGATSTLQIEPSRR
jgi:UDP-glucose 4-epimerase